MNLFQRLFHSYTVRKCECCYITLSRDRDILCAECFYSLPETNFHLIKDNPLAKLFWGRINFETATAFYYYEHRSKIQKLIHKLKYYGRKEIGIFFGREYGKVLKESGLFNDIDLIIPVPLYKDKEKRRGYNQSKLFAAGLSETMGVPYNFECLFRIIPTESQTRKKRYERWENVNKKFISKNSELLKNKHILLVDDVITTGATIEAAAKALLLIPDIRLSVASIAFAGI